MSQSKTSAKQYWALFYKYLRPQRFWLVVLTILVFGNIGNYCTPEIVRKCFRRIFIH